MLTRVGFTSVCANAFAGLGFSAEAPVTYEFPDGIFLPGGDLTPLKENVDKLLAGLTTWRPKTTQQGVSSPPMVVVEGVDYADALSQLQYEFQRKLWSDGLPFLPPTKQTVEWLLTGTDMPRGTLVAKIGPRGGIATVEALAVCLAMANGRPEYMPVLIAAIQAMTDPAGFHEKWQATTNNVFPVFVVNGPVAKQIRLGSGYGALGPDPAHPAGAVIGRAVRLIQMNMGGAVPGSGTMAIQGGPYRYANLVFAEDEEGLPADWMALNVEEGLPPGSNSVIAFHVSSATNIAGGETGTAEISRVSLLEAAMFMTTPNGNRWSGTTEGSVPGILVLARNTAQGLSKLGWSEDKVKQFLWDNSKTPIAQIKGTAAWWQPGPDLPDPAPVAARPQDIKIVVAGGDQSGHMMWLQVGCCGDNKLTKVGITLPPNWDALLKKAAVDLGPIPAR